MYRIGSRGKGSRRRPWRDGGAHKSKRPEWRKQAHHAVTDLADLSKPLASLRYTGTAGVPLSQSIYRFDQQIASRRIPYFPEYLGRWQGFLIYVTADYKAEVLEIVTDLAR